MPQKLSLEKFIEKAKSVHGDKYDYSLVEYKNSYSKIKLICPIHGEFEIVARDHIYSKCGCKKCSGNGKSNTDEFIKKARKIYGEKYDYSNVDYKNNKEKVCIICHNVDEQGNEHGVFFQRPNDHLSGYGCPKCGNRYTPTTEEWVAKARIVHGNRYDYSKTVYRSALSRLIITCPIHGDFEQIANNHLNGFNCPSCNCNKKSKMEESFAELLIENNISFERQKTFDWLKNKRSLFLDFYLPKYNIAIEVQGEQHFTPIEKFGGRYEFKVQTERDAAKRELCHEHNINLIYITKKSNADEVINAILSRKLARENLRKK